MKHLHNFIREVGKKSSWGTKELRAELGKVVQLESEERVKKLHRIEKLQKYDLVYLPLYGSVPHYILIEKVIGNKVFGIGLISTEAIHTLKPIEKDRILKGGYFSNTYCVLNLDTALATFVRVYENKSEANQVFRMVKQSYNELFLGRNRQIGRKHKSIPKQK